MDDWKCTGECRWVRKASPEIFQVTLILQQRWVKSQYGHINLGWTGEMPLGEQQEEWRDVPTVKEPEHE